MKYILNIGTRNLSFSKMESSSDISSSEHEEEEVYDDATLMYHEIVFKDEEIAKKLNDEEFKKWSGYDDTYDNTIRVLDEDGEISETKFQEVANKYKVEFEIYYVWDSKDKNGFKKEFKPK